MDTVGLSRPHLNSHCCHFFHGSYSSASPSAQPLFRAETTEMTWARRAPHVRAPVGRSPLRRLPTKVRFKRLDLRFLEIGVLRWASAVGGIALRAREHEGRDVPKEAELKEKLRSRTLKLNELQRDHWTSEMATFMTDRDGWRSVIHGVWKLPHVKSALSQFLDLGTSRPSCSRARRAIPPTALAH
eukprot:sb/3471353/